MNAHAQDMAAYESLLAFWRDAGVDACYLDAPIDHTEFKPLATPAAVQKLAAVPQTRGPAGSTNVASGKMSAQQLAGAANTLEELIAAIEQFEGCGLRKMGARHTLFGRGNPDADLLVIGDAPTDEDDAAGRAYASAPGQMMDRILAAANLTEHAYLTQTVFWQPPGNRAPTAEEQAVCAPFIERAAQLIKPKAVLVIGSVAARSVLGTEEPLMKLQGKWSEWSPADKMALPALATFHPRFLLQQPQAKGLVWQHILSVCTRL